MSDNNVSAELNPANIEKNESLANRKRVRHRKKLLYEKIMKQMDFYFSDANLTKDRYLGQLVKEDPFVPLEVFLKFNKIRALTHDCNDIAKALKHSTILELSEDRSKVKRLSPVQEYDVDSRTIYVESIPTSSNREWLEQAFKGFGPVAYISLPKYKDSQRIKGYAFVEFNSAEVADKCVLEMTKRGCKLGTDIPPEELSSTRSYQLEEEHTECEAPKKKSRKSKLIQANEENENHEQSKACNAKEESKPSDVKLLVLHKKEWKALRNRYLAARRGPKRNRRRNKNQVPREASPPPVEAATHIRFEDEAIDK